MKTNKPIRINIPISKIDEEQRIVTGIATTEALDSQGDIVDYEASKKAFSEWMGNIREMHGPVAIGKAIDIQFDDDTKQVIVSAKISESADGENAWIKVKEGILAGFSIGGRIFEVVKDKSVQGANRIVSYALSETSLVDNPANPEAMLMMVKSFDGNLQRVEAVVAPNNKLPDNWWMDKFMANKDIKKSVYDASVAISLATELAYLIMTESWEEENDQEQLTTLRAAFDALREFAAREVSEDDDYLGDYNNVIELARGAIDLRKGNKMAKEEDKVEKTNVVGGEERDHNAEVTQTQEEAGRPVDDTTERAAEAEKTTEDDKPVKDEEKKAPAKDPEDKADDKEKGKEKADGIADLAKNVETLLAKLNDDKTGKDFSKINDAFEKLSDKVEKSLTSLEGRVEALEKQPIPTKAKASFAVISKGDESKVEDVRAAAEKRQQELIDNPMDAKPGEAEQIAKALRTPVQAQEIK